VAPLISGFIDTEFLFCDIFEKGWVQNNLHALQDLKQNNELCTSNVIAEPLHWVTLNIIKSVNACIAERGGHLQHLT
jgi:hypothetical protein